MLIRLLFAFCLPLVVVACQRAEPPAVTSPPVVPEASIDWFDGDVNEALAAAKAADKPLFVYWGARWCPPCNQLKSTVFNRPDFVAETQRYVAVQVDGDDPDAQRWAEHFGAMGYPTLIVFDAQGRERTRLSSGMQLERYAKVLRRGADPGRSVADLLQAFAAETSPELSAVEWESLADHAWDVSDARKQDRDALRAQFLAWSQNANVPGDSLRQRFGVLYWLRSLDSAGELSPEQAQSGRALLQDVLNDRDSWRALLTDLQYSGVDLIALLAPAGSSEREVLLARFEALMNSVYRDESLPIKQRLLATRGLIDAQQLRRGEADWPPELVAEVVRRAEWASAAAKTPYERQSLIYNAAWYLHEVGRSEQAISMLRQELERSVAPYYYMSYLAEIEAARESDEAALRWSQQAWEAATGPATRFQWGSSHLQRLLKLAPDDEAAIWSTLDDIIRLMQQNPGSFYQRSRVRLQRLHQPLVDWAQGSPERQTKLGTMRAALKPVCSQLLSDSEAASTCREFLSGT